MVEDTRDDDTMFEIATVPPPAGELDAYSAVTRLESTPLHLMVSSMFAEEDVATDSVAPPDDSVLHAIDALDEGVKAIEPLTEARPTSIAPVAHGAGVMSMRLGDRILVAADLLTLGAFAVLAVLALFV